MITPATIPLSIIDADEKSLVAARRLALPAQQRDKYGIARRRRWAEHVEEIGPAKAVHFAPSAGKVAAIRRGRQGKILPQRELVGWLGFPASEAGVRLLRKIPPAACHVMSLLYLRTAMRDLDTRERLSHTHQLDATTLRLMSDERVRQRVSSGFVTALAAAAPGVGMISQHVRTLRDCLEMEALLPAAGVPRFTSIGQLIRHHDVLAARLNREGVSRWDNLQFPPPPLPGTDDIVPLLSPEALLAEGREQANCVASYGCRVARGGQFIYRVLAPERATLLVVRGRDGWQVGELAGPGNEPVAAVTRRAVERWLAGHSLQEEDPF